MHKVILNIQKDNIGDHIDGNALNNQKSNLRITSKANNTRNRKKSSLNTSGYKGVWFNKNIQKYIAEITYNGKKKYLGSSKDVKEAALMYNKAAKELFGDYARLNQI